MCLESQPQAPSGSGDSTSPCLKSSFFLGFFGFCALCHFLGVFKLCGTKPKTIFKVCNAAETEPAWPFQGPSGLSSWKGRRVSRFFAPKPWSESPFQRQGLFCLGLLWPGFCGSPQTCLCPEGFTQRLTHNPISGRRVSRLFAPQTWPESPFGLFCLGLLKARVLRLTPNLPAPKFLKGAGFLGFLPPKPDLRAHKAPKPKASAASGSSRPGFCGSPQTCLHPEGFTLGWPTTHFFRFLGFLPPNHDLRALDFECFCQRKSEFHWNPVFLGSSGQGFGSSPRTCLLRVLPVGSPTSYSQHQQNYLNNHFRAEVGKNT